MQVPLSGLQVPVLMPLLNMVVRFRVPHVDLFVNI